MTYLGTDFEPYLGVNYRHDFDRDEGGNTGGLPGGTVVTTSDDDEYEVMLGVRYFANEGISMSGEILKTLGRDRFENVSAYLTVRAEY